MKILRNLILMVLAIALWTSLAAAGGVIKLRPASPQPAADKLKPGLAVGYVYREVRWLDDAEGYRSYVSAKNRKTIKGFMYGDTSPGEKTLTSDADEYVIAFIEGYMHFEAGTYDLEFQSNDGVRVRLGGVEVYEKDGRFKCATEGAVTVKAPKTGWYVVKTLYFNRKFTSCLDLSIRSKGGDWDWTEENIYAHMPK